MPDQVRIYQGNTVQSMPLEQDKPLSFGENKKCDHCFPRGSCPGNSITLSVQNGVWTVSCEGNISCAGKPVTTAPVRNRDTFILNTDSALGLLCSTIRCSRSSACLKRPDFPADST